MNFFTGTESLNHNEMNKIKFLSGEFQIVNITRLIKLENTKRLKISLEGFSFYSLQVHKVEASCIHFNDIKNIK